MLRLLGVCLIALGLAALGFMRAAQERERLRQLQELLLALEELERQIGFQHSELHTICRCSAHPLLRHCAQGLQATRPLPLRDIWSEAIGVIYPLLEDEARALASQVGGVLGRYDAARQCQALAQARAELAPLMQEQRTQASRSGRVYRALGITAGALVFILLI